MSKDMKEIKDILSSEGTYTLKIRVIRLFKIPKKDDPNQFSSTDGDTIHDVIKESYMPNFSTLQEGNTYIISIFGIALYNIKYNFTSHKYKLIFYRNTILSPCSSISASLHGFKFVEFNKIFDSSLIEFYLHDAIGVLVGIDERIITFSKGKDKEGKRINLQLIDTRYLLIINFCLTLYFQFNI
ncbi:hypothetical protein V2J09_003986 [Rumex salicifolius]